MLDEEMAGAGRPGGEGEADADPDTPEPDHGGEPDAAALTAALLREPEVGEEHAETDGTKPTEPTEPAEPTEPTEAAEPTEATEAPDATQAGPAVEASRPRRGFGRRRLVAVAGGGMLVIAIAAGGAYMALPHASATPTPTPTRVAVDMATAAPTAVPVTAAPSPSQPEPTATPEPTEIQLSPDAGTLAFADDFTGKNAGWPTSSTSLTTLSMGTGVYAIGGKAASTDHLVEAPYEPRFGQIAITATATLSSAKGTAGFGVSCGGMTTPVAEPSLPAEASAAASPSGSREILFEFVVLTNGGWLITRRDGPPARSVQPVVLMHGTTASVPGAQPLTVSGICASAADGSRTRLILTINGLRVMDFSDVSATVLDGWRGGLVVSTVSAKASAAFRHVEIRDLSAQ